MTASARASRRRFSTPPMPGSPNGRSSALEISRPSSAGSGDRRGEEEHRDDQHPDRPPLLLDPAAALDVVDAAEGRVHRAPERGPHPQRSDHGGDADRRRAVADPIEDRSSVASSVAGKRRCRSSRILVCASLARAPARRRTGSAARTGKGEQQVVGDHPRQTGDVLPIGPIPERPQERQRGGRSPLWPRTRAARRGAACGRVTRNRRRQGVFAIPGGT